MSKGIVVVACQTHVPDVYCYIPYSVQCELSGVDDHENVGMVADGQVQRRIQLSIDDDGTYSVLRDELVYGYTRRDAKRHIGQPYETPDIASDEVGADMVDMALSIVCAVLYLEHCKANGNDGSERHAVQEF